MGRRIQPLLLVLLLGGAVLIARLWQIQVEAHELWADEAARLVHSGDLLPYERGRILARDGSVMVRDKPTYHLFLIYRDFRRGHPLGQVAHARSLLEGRAVPLEEAADALASWAEDLVRLLPEEVEAWSRGEGVERDGWSAPALEGDADERRRAARTLHRGNRVSDLHFYLRQLLGLGDRDWRALEKRIKRGGGGSSFLRLAAEQRGLPEEQLLAELLEGVEHAMAQLERFGVLAKLDEDGVNPILRARKGDPPLELVIHELERNRRWVEDASASKLFAEAAGFSPGRIAPEILLERVDLDWIGNLLAWDRRRLEEWAHTSREGWTENWRDGWALPRLHADLVLDKTRAATPDDVLDRLTALFNFEGGVGQRLDARFEKDVLTVPWNREERQCVLDSLDDWLAVDVDADLRDERLLPYGKEALRDRARELARQDSPEGGGRFQDPPDPWTLLDEALPASRRFAEPLPLIRDEELQQWLVSRFARRLTGLRGGRRLGRLLAGRTRAEEDLAFELTRRMGERWDAAFQDGLDRILGTLAQRAKREREVTSDGRLKVAASQRDRAIERADYYLKDYGLRPRALTRTEPDYEVVHVLARFSEDFAGLEAREAWEREVVVRAEDEGPLAAGITGRTSTVDERMQVANRRGAQRLRELWNQPRRGSQEEDELFALVGQVLLPDEIRGVSGVEGFFDPELRGANGYREEVGLQEVREAGETHRRRDPVNGQDVWLTIDLGLQRAAEHVLAHPPVITSDPKFDHDWAANPVGAIVLMTAEGDLLVAASEPTPFEEPDELAVGQRANPIERTLLMPTFQPPGSVLKPLVAWYALSRLGLDPLQRQTCAWIPGGGAGYVDLRCWNRNGHGAVDLHAALRGSCNAYFAWVGESLSGGEFLELASLFGLDRGTGVRMPPPWADGLRGRLGLREDFDRRVFRNGDLSEHERRMGGNGLGVLGTTPVQIARAFAAIGTGFLPSVRVVSRVGEVELPRREPERVDLDEGARRRVLAALLAVTNDRAGTAFAALSEDQLGFAVAAKTGSADITSRSDDPENKVRKHTWVAGFVPPEDPVAVFVIFVHDTSTTSSHGAVYVAESFLQTPQVRSYLQGEHVPLGSIRKR